MEVNRGKSPSGTRQAVNFDGGGLATPQADAAVAAADFDWIAQRREGDQLNFLAIEDSQFQQPLNQRTTRRKVIRQSLFRPGAIGRVSASQIGESGSTEGANKDAHVVVAADTQPASRHFEEAGTAGLNDLHLRAATNAKFGHAADPAGFALDILDHGHVAVRQTFERQ